MENLLKSCAFGRISHVQQDCHEAACVDFGTVYLSTQNVAISPIFSIRLRDNIIDKRCSWFWIYRLLEYVIGFTEVCRYYLLSVTKRDSILTPAELSTARLRCSRTLKTTGNIVSIGVTNILEAQLQTPNSRRERSLRVQCPRRCANSL